MPEFTFLDQWNNRPDYAGETNSGIDKVERTGVIPVRKRIEMYLQAGLNLKAQRAELFDYQEGETIPEDARPPVVRSTNFDRADATQLMRENIARARALYKSQKEDITEIQAQVNEGAEKKIEPASEPEKK